MTFQVQVSLGGSYNSMRSSLRLVLPLILSVAIVSVGFAAYQVRTEQRNLRRELERRAVLLAESLQDTIEPVIEKSETASGLERTVEKFGHREHLEGIAVYDANGKVLALTPGLGGPFRSAPAVAATAENQDSGAGAYLTLSETPTYIYALPLRRKNQIV